MWIKNGFVLDDSFQFIRADLEIEGSKIASIGNCCNQDYLDATDCYVVPGFIDTHMHGAMGKTFIDFDDDSAEIIAKFEARNGTTSLVPALSAARREKLMSCVTYLCECAEQHPTKDCANIHGMHLEGPFFSPHYQGAHMPENIRQPDVLELELLLKAGKGHIKILTMAPELPGADDVITLAVQNDVCVSAGHTDATFLEMQHSFSVGVTQGTHLFNAMRPLNHREPGTVGALLSEQTIRCELICDFVHVHPEVIQFVYHLKGKENINIITDSEVATGMPDGEYIVNGRKLIVENNRTITEDGTIAGGTSCMLDGVRNLVSIGIPLEDACMMASKNPAQTVGIYQETGSLMPGKTADVLILDKTLSLQHVLLRGKLLF